MTASTTVDRVRPGPGRPCTICEHPDRDAIDDDLRCGARLRTIAVRYGIASHANVSRHRNLGHVPPVPAPLPATHATDPERLKARFLELEERALRLLDAIEEVLRSEPSAAVLTTAMSGIGRLHDILKTLAQMGGMLDDRIVVITEAQAEQLARVTAEIIEQVIGRADEPPDVLRAARGEIARNAITTVQGAPR